MNINVNTRNNTKLVEKLRWYTYKIKRRQLITILSYKTWYEIKVET